MTLGERGGGWAIGLSACQACLLSPARLTLPDCGRLHLLQACGANPENGDRIRWLADQLFCPSSGPKQDQSPSYPAGSPRQGKRGTCLPTGRPTSLPHEPKLFIEQMLRIDRRSGSSINHGAATNLGENGPYRRVYTLSNTYTRGSNWTRFTSKFHQPPTLRVF